MHSKVELDTILFSSVRLINMISQCKLTFCVGPGEGVIDGLGVGGEVGYQ